MRYIDVRIRMPINKLGGFLETLPTWASMIGYDRLEQTSERPGRQNGKTHGGVYKPGKGTAAEGVLRVLTRPLVMSEIISRLDGKQKDKAVTSAIYMLANKGLIKKNKDGTYGKA
jgi:hypothetical protein